MRSNFLMNTAKEPLDGYDPFAGFRAEHEGNKQDISIFHSNVVKISDNTSIATPCNLQTTKILPHKDLCITILDSFNLRDLILF